jgi:hypothetical protein
MAFAESLGMSDEETRLIGCTRWLVDKTASVEAVLAT